MTDSFIGMKGSTGIVAKVTTPGKKPIYLAYPETISSDDLVKDATTVASIGLVPKEIKVITKKIERSRG